MGARVEWLRGAMSGTWSALGQRYTDFRDSVGGCLAAMTTDAVIASHFRRDSRRDRSCDRL